MINDIFAIEMYMILTGLLKWTKVKCYIAHENFIYDLLYESSSDICAVYQHLQDIRNQNCMTLTLTFRIVQGEM